MYKSILVPLDGSPLAEQALPHAIMLSEQCSARLILLRVLVPVPRTVGPTEWVTRKAEELTGQMAGEYLEGVAETTRERGIDVKTVAVEGTPHLEIIRFAEENQVDLIVLTARGQSGISRWLMGSVADRVVRGADVPVLLVKSRP